jgi:4-hydroxy-2-oxoheptanedioate aldolase
VEHSLHTSFREGRPLLGFWCAIGDSLVAETLASAGADYVCLDMQHGGAHEANLVAMLQAVAAGGSVPIVRVADSSPAGIMKVLDAGALGVVVPLVESAEQAGAAVSACRYPPAGTRSYGPFRASIHSGTADPRVLEQVACVAMIETRAGIEHLDEIVRTEGLTGIYVGPSDLSLALGLPPGSFDAPEFATVLDRIRAACAEHGLVAGIHCYDGTVASRYIEQGFGMVTVAVELRLLRAALAAELARARSAPQRAATTPAAG